MIIKYVESISLSAFVYGNITVTKSHSNALPLSVESIQDLKRNFPGKNVSVPIRIFSLRWTYSSEYTRSLEKKERWNLHNLFQFKAAISKAARKMVTLGKKKLLLSATMMDNSGNDQKLYSPARILHNFPTKLPIPLRKMPLHYMKFHESKYVSYIQGYHTSGFSRTCPLS
jgi:hypothetical protein